MKGNFIDDIKKTVLPMLATGAVGILPTDTLYGFVGSAFQKKTVERIYKLRERELKKPMIVLISSIDNLKLFDINISFKQKKILSSLWPGKVSVVLPCPLKEFEYLHRGKKTLAFRLPENEWLREFLKKTGPLVAPSANFAGQEPATTYTEAKKYFGDKVDFYVDFGKLRSKPSTLISLGKNGEIILLREGAVKAGVFRRLIN